MHACNIAENPSHKKSKRKKVELMIINPIYTEASLAKKLGFTSTVKEPMEVSRVTSGEPPSELAHIFQIEKGVLSMISVEEKLEREETRDKAILKGYL